jgi:hypothetical protein
LASSGAITGIFSDANDDNVSEINKIFGGMATIEAPPISNGFSLAIPYDFLSLLRE